MINDFHSVGQNGEFQSQSYQFLKNDRVSYFRKVPLLSQLITGHFAKTEIELFISAVFGLFFDNSDRPFLTSLQIMTGDLNHHFET